MTREIKRICLNTGGGDAPGLNAVIRGATLAALRRGWEVFGIRKGYEGLIDTDQIVALTRDKVRGITHLGGTILGTTNKGNPYERVVTQPDGSTQVVNIANLVVENFHKLKFDGLIAIGGDGSLTIANKFHEMGIPVVGVPKTIDNDLSSTQITFGFDTAVSVATEALDRLHTTAESHERVMCVELMGRTAGWIALHAGLAGGADVILIPEIPYDIESVCRQVLHREQTGRHFSIVVVAEGARPIGGDMVSKHKAEPGREIRLGGIAEVVAEQIAQKTGKETRSLVLGHLQRGGGPSTLDRLIGLRFGAAAVRAMAAGESGVMVALDPPNMLTVPLAEAVKRRFVPLDCDTIATARDLGICLGD